MDPADSDFLKVLFRENNDLRVKLSAAQRQIFNKTAQCEALEEELRNNIFKDDRTVKTEREREIPRTEKANVHIEASSKGSAKELEQALLAIESLNNQVSLLKSDLVKVGIESKDHASRADNAEKQTEVLNEIIRELENFKEEALEKEEREYQAKQQESKQAIPEKETVNIEDRVKELDATKAALKKQLIDIIQESNKIQNGLQNQLQGAQMLIETVRSEYEEFIQVTKLEYESYKNNHIQEYDSLKNSFESTKLKFLEEKKKMAQEYQTILVSMQNHFEDYRKTSEFLFNAELIKLADQLTTQAQKYEAEILYIVQAKDKFYSDLMVSKDAKIMSLIEGSDLQSLMQKNELDLENVRKEHIKEIERVKTDQEIESKNIISLLQRQNVNLETKCDKIQSHLKVMEGRMKELLTTIDQKNKGITERDELLLKTEIENKAKFAEINAKLSIVSQEKEHLRHKVIRLNLDARGEGENSIQNMIKRITRETADLRAEFDNTGAKYDGLLSENQTLIQKLKERDKMVKFLETEMGRRSEEFQSMTKTFEDFLEGRAKQSRKEQVRRLAKIASTSDVSIEKSEKKDINIGTNSAASKVLKAHIPDRAEHISASEASKSILGQVELERGYAYLKRFKNLSKAFGTGDFRIIAQGDHKTVERNIPGPWQQTPLYSKLNEASAFTQLYKEPPKKVFPQSDSEKKPIIYSTQTGEMDVIKQSVEKGLKLYEGKSSKLPYFLKAQEKDPQQSNSNRKNTNNILQIGGSGIKF